MKVYPQYCIFIILTGPSMQFDNNNSGWWCKRTRARADCKQKGHVDTSDVIRFFKIFIPSPLPMSSFYYRDDATSIPLVIFWLTPSSHWIIDGFSFIISHRLENRLERLRDHIVSPASFGSVTLRAHNLPAWPPPGPASLQAAWLVEWTGLRKGSLCGKISEKMVFHLIL